MGQLARALRSEDLRPVHGALPASPGTVVLASASPRRRALLEAAGWRPRVLVVDADESLRAGETPEQACERLALVKAHAGAARLRETGETALVVAGDTMVVVEGEVLGKPRDAHEARAMLGRLAGRDHVVLSSAALVALPSGRARSGLARAVVRVAPLTAAVLDAYLASGEWEGKAGAYAIQGEACRFATLVAGDLDTVIGLSVALVARLHASLGEGRAS